MTEEKTKETRRIRAISKAEMQRGMINRAEELRHGGHTIAAIAKDLDIAESSVRILLNLGENKTKVVSEASSMNLRIRAMKRAGYSNAAIGDVVGVSESTVRRRLQKPLSEAEQLTENMREYLNDAQEDILNVLSEDPIFREMFGEQVVLRVHTVQKRTTLTPGKRVTFKLEFSAHKREN